MARTHERTAARRCAVQILYTSAIRNEPATSLMRSGGVDCIEGTVSDYAVRLIEGVEEHKDELDSSLSSISKNWTVSRMPIMDLAILRIALFEMMHVEEVPVSVSINEAVEMAKFFGGEDESPKFVNGMLGNVARHMEGDGASAEVDVDIALDEETQADATADGREGDE